MITITDAVKRRFRLERIIADVQRGNWKGKDIEFTVKNDNSASINDTTRGGPNHMEATYVIMGNRAEVSISVHAETNSHDGIKDISATIRDQQGKEIEISDVRFVVTTELQECMLRVEQKPIPVLYGLVGGPMGDPTHMFIIDESYNVFVGTENDTREDYALAGYLVSNLDPRSAEANGLEIIGSYPDNYGDDHYISLGWSVSFISGVTPNEKQEWFKRLDALVAMLLEKIKVPA